MKIWKSVRHDDVKNGEHDDDDVNDDDYDCHVCGKYVVNDLDGDVYCHYYYVHDGGYRSQP